MKLNENVIVIGERVVLVPYKKHHVLKYHQWMQQKDLQELTASEPLSLEEEFAMQLLWQNDEKKLTFIIMDKTKWSQFCKANGPPKWSELPVSENISKQSLDLSSIDTDNSIDAESKCMVGDVNLFCCGETWSEGAEISIMIAENAYRRKGYAVEAAQLMINYAVASLPITNVFAKIGINNDPSIKLFTQKLDFVFVNRSNVFNEVTLANDVSDRKQPFLNRVYHIANYFSPEFNS